MNIIVGRQSPRAHRRRRRRPPVLRLLIIIMKRCWVASFWLGGAFLLRRASLSLCWGVGGARVKGTGASRRPPRTFSGDCLLAARPLPAAPPAPGCSSASSSSIHSYDRLAAAAVAAAAFPPPAPPPPCFLWCLSTLPVASPEAGLFAALLPAATPPAAPSLLPPRPF